MSSPFPSVDFSLLKESWTAEDIYEAALDIREVLLPEHTNRSLSDPSNIDLVLFSGIAEHLLEQFNAEQIQLILQRANRRANILNELRLAGTSLRPMSAAVVTEQITLVGDAKSGDIVIPQWHPFEAPDSGEQFVVTDEAAILPAYSTSTTVTLMHGQRGLEILTPLGDGTANQVFEIETENIVQNEAQKTLEVYVEPLDPADGPTIRWTVVSGLEDSLPTDLHCVFARKPDSKAKLLFGDGKNGARPEDGLRVRISFVEGGGTAGNVSKGAITSILEELTFDGESVSVNVTNTEDASGGLAEQTLENARRFGPELGRAQDRGINRADYAALARAYPGVLDAGASRVAMDTIEIAVVGASISGTPSSALLTGLLQSLAAKAGETDSLRAVAARRIAVDGAMVVRAKAGYDTAQVTQTVLRLRQEYFDLFVRQAAGLALLGDPTSSRGHAFTSDFIAAIDNATGVENLELTKFTRVPVPRYDKWSGASDFSVIVVSTSTVEEEITVTFTSSTTYRVDGSVSGRLGTGTTGVEFQDERARVTLTVTVGAGMEFSDRARFRVSPLVGPVKCQADEYFAEGTWTVDVVAA